MIFSHIIRRLPGQLLAFGLVCFQLELAHAQINVTNCGAIGDLLTLATINTVSNSTALTCPGANFVSSDLNKAIERKADYTEAIRDRAALIARLAQR